MQTRRFDFNWSPLIVSRTLITDKSVPDRQTYDINTGVFTPDYKITPLMISPLVSVVDKDKYIPNGDVTKELANISWTEIVGGVRTVITGDNANYTILRDAEHNGSILVKRNVMPANPITLEFRAEYMDPRTRQVHSIIGSKLIKSKEEEKDVRVTVSAPAQTLYDPLTDFDEQIASAHVWIGDREMEASGFNLEWEYSMDGLGWSPAIGNIALEVGNNLIKIHRELMGDRVNIRCTANILNQNGSANKTVQTMFSLIRRIPKFEFEIDETPNNINIDTKFIHPTVTIRNSKGIINDLKNVLMPVWYVAKNDPTGIKYEEVAYGKHPKISTSIMDPENGMMLAVDVVDRGSLMIAVDPVTGEEYVDLDGKRFLIN